MNRDLKTFFAMMLCTLAPQCAMQAQTTPPTMLEVDFENTVMYFEDTPDLTKLATIPGPTPASLAFTTVGTYPYLASPFPSFFNGSVTVMTPVPEPCTSWLMLASFGIGVVPAIRRSMESTRAFRTIGGVILCLAGCEMARAQGPPVTILQIETQNQVRYVYDTSDLSSFAKVQTPIDQAFPTFATWVTEGDIVTVNRKPAKGIYLTRQVAINLLLQPPAGQGIADLVATNMVDRILVLMQPDGTPIGSIVMLGLDGGNPPPGAPAQSRQSNFAITGGTGAFLGVRGQFEAGPTIPGAPGTRNASVREDPARRRINGGASSAYILHLIPMSRPEIAITAGGPAVTHADFSPVTGAKPAKAGEVLVVKATGLGPTVPGVDPGQPFPSDPLVTVNSPLDVTVNGQAAEIINKIGWPGLLDTYRVDFRVPDGTTPGTAAIQLTAAWIAGPSVNIPIQ